MYGKISLCWAGDGGAGGITGADRSTLPKLACAHGRLTVLPLAFAASEQVQVSLATENSVHDGVAQQRSQHAAVCVGQSWAPWLGPKVFKSGPR